MFKIKLTLSIILSSLLMATSVYAQDSDSTTYNLLNFYTGPMQTTAVTGGSRPPPPPPPPPAPPVVPPAVTTPATGFTGNPAQACASALNFTYSDFVNYETFTQTTQGINAILSIQPNLVISDTNPNPKYCGTVNYYTCTVNMQTGAVSMAYTGVFLGPCNQGGSR